MTSKIHRWWIDKEHTISLVCRSSSSLTANAICFVLITVSSNFSRPSSCSVPKPHIWRIRMEEKQVLLNKSSYLPFIICLWRPTRPRLSKPSVLLMASSGFISGPSKLSLLAKFDMFKVEAIWLTFDLKFVSMSLRRFISFSDLFTHKHCYKTSNNSNKKSRSCHGGLSNNYQVHQENFVPQNFAQYL